MLILQQILLCQEICLKKYTNKMNCDGNGVKRGGVTFAKIICGCACWTLKIWLSLYQFFTQLLTHQYTIFDRKYWILLKLGAFYNNLLKIHQIFEFGLLCPWWKPTICYTKFHKKVLQRQAHIHIPCQCENSPPPWNQRSDLRRMAKQVLVIEQYCC